MATSRSSRAARSNSACKRADEPLVIASSMASDSAPATSAPRVLRSRENQRSVNWSINGKTTKRGDHQRNQQRDQEPQLQL